MIHLYVELALLAIIALLGVGYVWLLDRREEKRERWTRSVPTITSLPRATARRRRA